MRSPRILLAVVGLALLDGFLTRVLAYLPAVVVARGAPGDSVAPIVAAGSVLAILVSPVVAFLFGSRVADDLAVADRLAATTAILFVLGFVGVVAGLAAGILVAPGDLDAAGSLGVRLLVGGMEGVAGGTVLTLAVVGGAALGRVRTDARRP